VPAREQLRVDLKQAIDNGDGTINARRFPLFIWPRRDGGYVKTQIDEITISPATGVVEIWEQGGRGDVRKYSTFAGGSLPHSIASEFQPVRLDLYNLSRDSGVTLIFMLVSWRHNEPGGS
jgi:hypothetical protein